MAKVKVSTLTNSQIRDLAKDRLIAAQKCSKKATAYYSVASYGYDMNGWDYSRKWLAEELMATSPTANAEQIRIVANKLVLYVNPKELESMAQVVRNEVHARKMATA